jgi:hypothetical protein
MTMVDDTEKQTLNMFRCELLRYAYKQYHYNNIVYAVPYGTEQYGTETVPYSV